MSEDGSTIFYNRKKIRPQGGETCNHVIYRNLLRKRVEPKDLQTKIDILAGKEFTGIHVCGEGEKEENKTTL